jgi:hypothetical protein
MMRTLAVRVSILSLSVLLAGLCASALAQSRANPQESLESLTTDANDPTAILAQLKIEEDYTPEEFGTQAAPNTIQIQPVIPYQTIFTDATGAIGQTYIQGHHDSLRQRAINQHLVRRYGILRPVRLQMAGPEGNRS